MRGEYCWLPVDAAVESIRVKPSTLVFAAWVKPLARLAAGVVEVSEVNAPLEGVLAPIGVESKFVADKVVNAPVEGVVAPIAEAMMPPVTVSVPAMVVAEVEGVPVPVADHTAAPPAPIRIVFVVPPAALSIAVLVPINTLFDPEVRVAFATP
jgi:hypothetical protein